MAALVAAVAGSSRAAQPYPYADTFTPPPPRVSRKRKAPSLSPAPSLDTLASARPVYRQAWLLGSDVSSASSLASPTPDHALVGCWSGVVAWLRTWLGVA